MDVVVDVVEEDEGVVNVFVWFRFEVVVVVVVLDGEIDGLLVVVRTAASLLCCKSKGGGGAGVGFVVADWDWLFKFIDEDDEELLDEGDDGSWMGTNVYLFWRSLFVFVFNLGQANESLPLVDAAFSLSCKLDSAPLLFNCLSVELLLLLL